MYNNNNNNIRRNTNNNKRNQSITRKQSIHDPALELRPSFRGQPVWSVKALADYHKATTTVTTGLMQVNLAISVADLTNFAARFIAFEEYRIVKSVFRINCFSSTNPGLVVAYIDDDDNTAPTLNNATAHKNITFNASDTGRIHELVYTPHSPTDQAWQTVATGTTAIGYFKVYSSSALGASIVATDYIGYVMEHTLQFRGLTV